jgi:hypothetical protein
MQNAVRSPRSLALAALALSLIAIGVVALVARPFVGSASAQEAPGFGGPPWARGGWHVGWHAGPGAAFMGTQLPPELAGLVDVPADQRFSHFRGVQVQLTDKDNRPLRVDVTPGTVTAVSNTSLTVAGNDGTTRSYTLDDKTLKRGDLRQNDKVVVATLNGSQTATAAFRADDHGFGAKGPWGR